MRTAGDVGAAARVLNDIEALQAVIARLVFGANHFQFQEFILYPLPADLVLQWSSVAGR